MRSPLLPISLSLLLLSWQTVQAQLLPADNFFNSGAQLYISNNIPSALEQVESGLKIYPDDEKLKKLEQLLKQKQQQQQSQQNQKQQDQKDQQSKQDQKDQQQNQSQKDQQSQPEKSNDQKNQQPDPKKSPDQQKKEDEEKKQEQKKSAGEKKDGEKPEDQKGEGQPLAPGQMTPEEAKRLLDAQKGNEQVLKWQPNGKPENPKGPTKDW